MAIKKRPPVDPAREAEIEAFGAAAETPTGVLANPPAPPAAPAVSRRPRAAAVGGKTEFKPMLMRLEGWEHELLKEVAELEGRSMHNMAKYALIPALEAIKAARNA